MSLLDALDAAILETEKQMEDQGSDEETGKDEEKENDGPRQQATESISTVGNRCRVFAHT